MIGQGGDMDINKLIKQRVHNYYWELDLNCATTMLRILSEIIGIDLQHQVLDAAAGMHGAGKYRAQCGLVEGGLMFIGIIGNMKGVTKPLIEKNCYNFALKYEKEFGSLVCRELRPEGFKENNPPHLCAELTEKAVKFTKNYLLETLE